MHTLALRPTGVDGPSVTTSELVALLVALVGDVTVALMLNARLAPCIVYPCSRHEICLSRQAQQFGVLQVPHPVFVLLVELCKSVPPATVMLWHTLPAKWATQ